MQQLKIFGCLLAIVATITSLHCASIYNFGDVEIYVNETEFKCDKIFCPPEAHMCRVTKEKLKPDAEQVQRVNTCFSKNNEVLKEVTNHDPIGATQSISLSVTVYRDGGVVSSSNFISGNNYNYITTSGDGGQFDQKLLDISLAKVEENLRNVNKQVEQQMQNLGNLFNGWG